MEVVPFSVGRVSRSWDEQALDVASAAGQIGSAATGLAEAAEGRADGLRAVIADYLATDQAVGAELLGLASYLREQR